jgi:hypothetical protein
MRAKASRFKDFAVVCARRKLEKRRLTDGLLGARLKDFAADRVKLVSLPWKTRLEPRGRLTNRVLGSALCSPMDTLGWPCGTSDGGVTSFAVPAGVFQGIARIATNVKKKTE